MSWKQAIKEAEKWMQTLNLPKKIKGEFVDLNLLAEETHLPFDGQFTKNGQTTNKDLIP